MASCPPITDPGNAASAIHPSVRLIAPVHTPVGSRTTRRRGRTLDGRTKPDLVAPGERITSAAAGADGRGI
ncbi:serine peptidase domain protein [Mycobacteroides abscessus]|nr:serine peptidase domain protein [Mycobacteroides abscessus]